MRLWFLKINFWDISFFGQYMGPMSVMSKLSAINSMHLLKFICHWGGASPSFWGKVPENGNFLTVIYWFYHDSWHRGVFSCNFSPPWGKKWTFTNFSPSLAKAGYGSDEYSYFTLHTQFGLLSVFTLIFTVIAFFMLIWFLHVVQMTVWSLLLIAIMV